MRLDLEKVMARSQEGKPRERPRDMPRKKTFIVKKFKANPESMERISEIIGTTPTGEEPTVDSQPRVKKNLKPYEQTDI